MNYSVMHFSAVAELAASPRHSQECLACQPNLTPGHLMIAAFDGALHERDLRQDDLVQARARIEAALARAFEAIETLDVAVANHLGNDPVTLAVWTRNRRVAYSGRTRTEASEPAVPPAAAA